MNKNQKISSSLKKHYRRKKAKKQIIILIWILSLVVLMGIYTTHDVLRTTQAKAPEDYIHGKLPESTNAKLTVPMQIRLLAKQENFQWPDYLVRLAYCESRFDTSAINENGGHSLDRGLFQINKKYHPEVSNECAFDLTCSTKWTMMRITNGYQHEWMCNDLI